MIEYRLHMKALTSILVVRKNVNDHLRNVLEVSQASFARDISHGAARHSDKLRRPPAGMILLGEKSQGWSEHLRFRCCACLFCDIEDQRRGK